MHLSTFAHTWGYTHICTHTHALTHMPRAYTQAYTPLVHSINTHTRRHTCMNLYYTRTQQWITACTRTNARNT